MAKLDLMFTFDYLAKTTDFPEDWRETEAANLTLNQHSYFPAKEILSQLRKSPEGRSFLENNALITGELFRSWHDHSSSEAVEALLQMPEPINTAIKYIHIA